MIRSKAGPGPRRESELKCFPDQTRPCKFLKIRLTDSRMCEILQTRMQLLDHAYPVRSHRSSHRGGAHLKMGHPVKPF